MTATILTSHEGLYGIQETIDGLRSGASALDSLERGIKRIEDDIRARTVGFGGAPNALGVMQLDASVMNGATLEVGAVGALLGCRYPFSVARKVMETLPHVLLAGEGASRFAQEMGIEQAEPLAAEARQDYEKWAAEHFSDEQRKNLGGVALAPHISFKTRTDLSKGTVTFLVRDDAGHLFGGVSTSGWAYKYPGRLGDSPIVGAGMYVDNRYGGAACTHTGEMTIRAGTARSVVLYMKRGATVEEAVREAIADLRYLKGGYLGPVIIHALNREGEPFVATTGGNQGDVYCFWQQGLPGFERREPILVA